MNTLQSAAQWLSGPAIETLPETARALIRRAFKDTLAVALLGSRSPAAQMVSALAAPAGNISVFGMGRRTSVFDAALINGTAAHADLFDDNSTPMIAHPSAALVTALLALGQQLGASGADVSNAYGVGFEVGVRLGRRLNPQLYEAGWHVTRVLGVLGATAACARLLRLDAPHCAAALGIAASMAGGIRQNFGTSTMALHAGLTARDAIHAAQLACAGFGADLGAWDGKYGLFQVFSRQALAAIEFGNPFELVSSGLIFKPYPSGAPTHAAVDAALTLRAKLAGRIEQIDTIRCQVHPWNAMTLREDEPHDANQARVSLRYCIAAALHWGALGPRQFAVAALGDPAVRALMQRIQIETAADLPSNGEFPAHLWINLTSGAQFDARCEVPPGGTGRRLSDAEVTGKFQLCADGILDAGTVSRVLDMIDALDQLTSVATLCEALESHGRAPSEHP